MSGGRAKTSSSRSVRSQIADQTRDAHNALHVHPVLGRLISPDIGADEYREILLTYLSFYQAAENARMSFAVLPLLSFGQELDALRQDLDCNDAVQTQVLPITSPLEALGMLYVLHGSRFGATVILRHLKRAIPRNMHAYFGLTVDKAHWQTLLAEMEEHQGQHSEILEIALGAKKTFFALDQWMSAILEVRPDLASLTLHKVD